MLIQLPKWALHSLIAVTLSCASFFAFAQQAFPNKPIRLIVGFAPGGGTDIVARAIAPKMGEILGQSVIVENKSGAAGTIAADQIAKANPDGYTLLVGHSNSNAIAPFVLSSVPYNPATDFTPITYLGYVPNVLVVKSSLPVNSVAQLISLAKSNPGQMTYGSSGIGSTQHLAGALFSNIAGVQMNHVPYKGSGPAMTDLVAGQVNLMVETVPAALPFITSGQLRPLAVTTAKRISMLPDVPTTAESGMPTLEVSSTFGVLAPTGTPTAIIDQLNTAIAKLLVNPEVKEAFLKQGVYAANPTKPKQSALLLEGEVKRWEKVIKDADIKAE